MPTRTSSAEWKGTLKQGAGTMRLGSGAWEGPFTFSSRFESGAGTNPEELIGAAHAGCFSMFLAGLLTEAGFTPRSIRTKASVHLEAGPTIARIDLATEADVPGLDATGLQEHAEKAKKNCPVSKALAGPQITLAARLV
ncbi:MAG TPA: OsmC family protein [Candidatus Methanoperedens sp.]|nr:OsmC family protein [Candidatus Methanoperedens sp.]